MTTREDRIKGAVLGSAAADALGVHYETGIPSHGHAKMLGGGYGFEPGEWSDDTQQAICVLKGKSNPEQVGRNLLDWYRGGPVDVGPTTGRTLAKMSVMARPYMGAPLALAMTEASKVAAGSRAPGWASNGSLMRTGPLCLPFLGDRDRIAKAAREVSDLTHFDPLAGDACVLWSLAIDAAVAGYAYFPAFLGGLDFIPADRREYWAPVIHDAANVTSSAVPPRSNLNVVKAFQAALWAVVHSFSYETGVQAAIAIGGDTDTVAAIAGALLGAVYGAPEIPAEWLSVLHGWPGLKAADLEALALDAAGA